MYRSTTLTVNDSPMHTLIIAQHLPVAHEGLEKDPFTIEVVERYAAAGYVCAIPFIFHYWPPEENLAVKREEFRDDWTVDDIKATFDTLSGMDKVDADRTGILGHCWGGRVAWLSSCHIPQLKGCAVFYGGRVKVPHADNGPAPIALADRIQCPVLGIFGNDDQSPSPEDVNDYEQALVDADVLHEFHRYDGAGHGFQDHTNADRYRQEQAEDAWSKAVAFFARQLS
ncbi:MAG: hypothetical protein CME19_13810 [Gemmatimonadetes bacterium]|nr:hypothetical protein [Gemmatimonadota bacterium]|tara:strand:+ start:457 stop:1137 length:681 start_codon:yes stop_codon:yes gene_type:complete